MNRLWIQTCSLTPLGFSLQRENIDVDPVSDIIKRPLGGNLGFGFDLLYLLS
jgi:hypothetical protein